MTVNSGRKLKIHDQDLAIKLTLEDLPYKILWPREVWFNCKKAGEDYTANTTKPLKRPTEVWVKGIEIKDFFDGIKKTAPKLMFGNLGSMTGDELDASADINSDVGLKAHGDGSHLGQGEKINLLNFTDILKIAYKNGQGHYHILSNEDGTPQSLYGVQKLDPEWLETYKEELEVDLEHDWTLTILLGQPGDENLKHQNTVTHPHGPEGDKHKGHFIKTLFARVYDNAMGVKTVLVTDKDKDKTPHSAGRNPGERMPFKTTDEFWNEVQSNNKECFVDVISHNGIKYHFYYDAPDKNKEPSSTSITQSHGKLNFMSLICGPFGERERYDVQYVTGKWKSLSSRFGIYLDEKFFRVDIELPNSDYRTYGNRVGISLKKEKGGDGSLVKYEDFIDEAVLVAKTTPRWNAKVEEHKNKVEALDLKQRIKDKLKDFFSDIEHGGIASNKPGKKHSKKYKPNGNRKHTHQHRKHTPKISVGGEPEIPEVIMNGSKTGPDMFASYTDKGDAGTPVLFVNPGHPVVSKTLKRFNYDENLEKEYREECVNLHGIDLAVKVCITKAFKDKAVNGIDENAFNILTDPMNLTLFAELNDGVVKQLRSSKLLKAKETEAKHGTDWKPSNPDAEACGYKGPGTYPGMRPLRTKLNQ